MKTRTLLTMFMMAPHFATAAAFCTSVQGLPDQCIYEDGRECQARAVQLGGVCVANASAIANRFGSGRFCLSTDAQMALCLYSDRNTCQNEASRRHAVCTEAPEPASAGVDPYAIRRPY